MNEISIRRNRLIKCSLAFLIIGLYAAMMLSKAFVNFALMSVQAQSANSNKKTQDKRFDEIVREDFFAGMLGDEESLERGMRYCEDILAKNPRHAEALVWHGGGLLTRAANVYKKGDYKLGDKLWKQGIKEMNDAALLEPDNMAVKIGRSATLVGLSQAGWDSSDRESRALLESALADYEKVYEWQKPTFRTLGEHSRGELLFGLASGWSILGNHQKAREYLQLIVKECKGTIYEAEARKWLKDKQQTVIQHDCTGCHTSPSL